MGGGQGATVEAEAQALRASAVPRLPCYEDEHLLAGANRASISLGTRCELPRSTVGPTGCLRGRNS